MIQWSVPDAKTARMLNLTFCHCKTFHTPEVQYRSVLHTTFPEQLSSIDQNNFAGKTMLMIFHMLQTKLQCIVVLSRFRSSTSKMENGFS